MGCGKILQVRIKNPNKTKETIETLSVDSSSRKKVEIYNIVKAREEINKIKVLNAPILNVYANALYNKRIRRAIHSEVY